jgi:AcrR family transcriptional regulator
MVGSRKVQPSSRDDRRELVRQQMFASVERFLEGGGSYMDLSVDQLAAEANVSRSTFYVYFEDKGNLLKLLSKDVLVDLMEAAEAWWAMPPDATREELRDAFRPIFEAYRQNQTLWRAIIETATYHRRVAAEFDEMLRHSAVRIADHIRARADAGFVRRGVHPESAAAWLSSMTERGLHQLIHADTAPDEFERLLETHVDIYWTYLYEGTGRSRDAPQHAGAGADDAAATRPGATDSS